MRSSDGGVQKMVSPFFEHQPSRIAEWLPDIFLFLWFSWCPSWFLNLSSYDDSKALRISSAIPSSSDRSGLVK